MDTREELAARAISSSEPSQVLGEAPAIEATATEASATEPIKDAKAVEDAGGTKDTETVKQIGETQQVVDGDQGDAASEVSSALSTDDWGSETFESDLLNALDDIQTQGSFASFRPLESLSLGLFVHDVGPITLPLAESQIQKLIDKAVQSPFGKESEAIVNTTVRNTWELDSRHFELRSPRWATDLRTICTTVADDLGIKSPINAELCKLLVYEKGAMFTAHTDTEKCPGMFGTLVVCLPSVHKGGDVVVKYSGETKTFKTSEAAQSFACWYSDVHHEVLPVTDGHRVVLTYNLTIDPTVERPSAGLVRSENRKLRHTLRRWLRKGRGSGEVDHVYYGLGHEYTEASMSMKALKGRDLAVIRTLQELASGLDFDVLLALTEKTETVSAEPHGYDPYGSQRSSCYGCYDDEEEDESEPDHIEEVFDTELAVKVLVDLSGRPILRDMALEEDNCLQGEDFFEGASREEDYEGYQANWGPLATQWYRVTAALIIRRDSMAEFLKSSLVRNPHHSDEAIALLLAYLADSILEAAPNQKSAFDTLKDIWNTSGLRSGRTRPKLGGEVISKMLQAAVEMEQWDFFESAARTHRGALPAECCTWLRKQVEERKVSFDKVKTGYALPDGPIYRGDMLITYASDSLASAVLGCTYFFESCKAMEAFASTDQPLSDEVREWARKTLVKALKACSRSASFVGPDGSSVVANAQKYADFDWLSSTVVPLIEDHFVLPAFALNFLSALILCARKKVFPVKEAVMLYKRLAKGFVSKLDFSKIHGPRPEEQAPKAARHTYGQTAPGPPETDKRSAVTPDALADLFSALAKLSSPPREDLAMPLAMKLVGFAPKMRPADFHPLWIPFLRELIAVLETARMPLTTPRYQQMFGAVLESYRDNYVGRRTAAPTSGPHSGTHLQRYCRCADCRKLDAFLADPAQQSCRFPVGRRARHHLHQQIERHGIRCSHVSDRGGPQDTLVVTKLGETADAKHEARQKMAAETFQTFDQTKLGLLLGEDYPAIAEGLWKRPVNLTAGRSGVGVPLPGGMPGARPAASMPAAAAPLPGYRPAPGWLNGASGPVANGVVAPMTGYPSGPPGPLPSFGSMDPAAAAPPPSGPVPSRVGKRKAEPEIIDLT